MQEPVKGGIGMFFAYVIWGLMPLYWSAMDSVDAIEVLCHRVFWSFVFTGVLVTLRGDLIKSLRFIAGRRDLYLRFAASSVFISVNWGVYIWAVHCGDVLSASLAYFMNPLVTILLARIFFRERLNRMQTAAILFAVCGVAVQVAVIGKLPLTSLAMALSFGLYGVCKKKIDMEACGGMMVETALIVPLALLWMAFLQSKGVSQYPYSLGLNLLLAGTGIITSIPLILYAWGLQRTTLTTSGLIQFVSPTLTFALAIFYYHEPISATRIAAFALIWTGLAVYIADTLLRRSKPWGSTPNPARERSPLDPDL